MNLQGLNAHQVSEELHYTKGTKFVIFRMTHQKLSQKSGNGVFCGGTTAAKHLTLPFLS